jgi:hypothetical protein
MFENEHTFCSWMHHFHSCTAFAPINQNDLDSSVTGEVGRGVDLLLVSFLYRITWLFLGCILNGTSCIKQHDVGLYLRRGSAWWWNVHLQFHVLSMYFLLTMAGCFVLLYGTSGNRFMRRPHGSWCPYKKRVGAYMLHYIFWITLSDSWRYVQTRLNQFWRSMVWSTNMKLIQNGLRGAFSQWSSNKDVGSRHIEVFYFGFTHCLTWNTYVCIRR